MHDICTGLSFTNMYQVSILSFGGKGELTRGGGGL